MRVRELLSLRSVPTTEADSILAFPSEKESTYSVDRPGDPWERQPVHTISAPDVVAE